MNTEEFESMAAELTDSVGLQDDGSGDVSDSLAADLHDQEQHIVERDIPANNEVQDEAQYQIDRDIEQEQTQHRNKKVPLAALQEERQKRQNLELQLAAYQQQAAQFQAQQQAAQQQAQQAQQEAEVPDFDSDPRAYIEYREKQFAQQLEQLKGGQGQQPQVQQIEAQVMQEASALAPVITDMEARFEAANPDYRQAFDHVQQTVEANMRAQHPGINEQQLGMLRTAALVALAKQCQAQGVNVAEHVYQRAQAMGFQTASRAPRREAPTSLASLSGTARAPDERGAITASQISDMSQAEFDKFWESEIKGGGGSQGPAF